MSDNVVPFRKSASKKKQTSDMAGTPDQDPLEQIAEKNQLNQERLRKERIKYTLDVLKAYRIKG